MIELKNLSLSFGTKQVLNNLNFRFEDGKVYGIVGENGAGKTSLFRCIAGLENYSGKIEEHPAPLKNYLGYLASEPFFLPKITGEEYILLLAEARKRKINSAEKFNLFQLPLKEFASQYSTGMKKKLALTAVLAQNNDWFILDEPFNGLDLQSNIVLTDLILQLKAKSKSILIASHIFSTLKETCDEIILLSGGNFLEIVQKEHFDRLEIKLKEDILSHQFDFLNY